MRKWIEDIISHLKGMSSVRSHKHSHKTKTLSEKEIFKWLDPSKKPKWDELNRPIGYIVGVTPGFALIQRSPETFKDLGLMRKYMKGGLFGFEFVQLDYETISEINERYLREIIEEAKKYQGLEIGIHAPVADQSAVDLGIALANQWSLHHRTIQRTAYSCGEILGAKYFLFHSSSQPRPNIAFGVSPEERYGARGQLYSFTGMNLGRWIKQVDGLSPTVFEGQTYDQFVDPCYRKKYKNPEGFSLKDYFLARLMYVLFEVRGYSLDPELALYFYYQETYSKGVENAKKVRDELINRHFDQIKNQVLDQINSNIDKLNNIIQFFKKSLEDPNTTAEFKEILKNLINVFGGLQEKANELLNAITNIDKFSVTYSDGSFEESKEMKKIIEDIKEYYIKNIQRIYKEYYDQFVNIASDLIGIYDKTFKEKIRKILEDIIKGDYEGIDEYDRRAVKALYILDSGRIDLEESFEYWTEIKGSEAGEEVAYIVTAKYMYVSKDYIWMNIVGLNYSNGLNDAYDPDDVIIATNLGFKKMKDFYHYTSTKGNKPFIHRLEKYSKAFQDFILNKEKRTPLQIAEDMVAAVASKYIQGHLFVKDEWAMDTLPEWLYKIGAFVREDMVPFNNESVYDYAERGGSFGKPIQIFVETEQPANDAMVGKLRLMKGKHHVILVKSIVEYASNLLKNPSPDIIPRSKGPYKDIFSYNIDFEHLSVNLIDPIEDAKSLDEGDGKHIRMLHVNAPRPYKGQHGPFFMFSDELYVIYEWMWELRKKGMKNAYFIMEMGSYGIQQSALAFRKFAAALEHDIPPEELPAEFFGIDEALLAEQQRALIEHAYDPLEGLLLQPEEKHTFLGNAAKEKGKLGEWAKEELR
ncbi:MAG: hypothetical protein GXN99_01525 [Candidatus Nanohaloarchaeota archaeon]|nr:hypothetical protein [Candidatus Nanohaloarchaeota archaeon]